MANFREYNAKIRQLQNMRRVTLAMKMLSTTKLARAQEAMTRAQGFGTECRRRRGGRAPDFHRHRRRFLAPPLHTEEQGGNQQQVHRRCQKQGGHVRLVVFREGGGGIHSQWFPDRALICPWAEPANQRA